MKLLDLFSGIGGFSLGFGRVSIKTVAFCEQDAFCQKVLKKNFPGVPIFDDIKKFTRADVPGTIDIISGGPPCQPWSQAGKRGGHTDDRDLWPEMFRVIKEFKPEWVVAENVAGFITNPMGLPRTKFDLESEGYCTFPIVIPACAVRAKHRRDRVWILAHNKSDGLTRRTRAQARDGGRRKVCCATEKNRANIWDSPTHDGLDFTDAKSLRVQGGGAIGEQEPQPQAEKALSGCGASRGTGDAREDQPGMGGSIHGLPPRVDRHRLESLPPLVDKRNRNWANRIKSLGNAIVPQIAEVIGRAIIEAESYE